MWHGSGAVWYIPDAKAVLMLGIFEAHICGGILPQVPLRSTRGCVCYASPTLSSKTVAAPRGVCNILVINGLVADARAVASLHLDGGHWTRLLHVAALQSIGNQYDSRGHTGIGPGCSTKQPYNQLWVSSLVTDARAVTSLLYGIIKKGLREQRNPFLMVFYNENQMFSLACLTSVEISGSGRIPSRMRRASMVGSCPRKRR